jgi:peptide/nickel transport system ATP-binding protein
VAVIYLGEIVEIGTREEIFSNPQHAYTRKLLDAVPIPDPERRKTKRRVESHEVKNPIRPVDYIAPERAYRQISSTHSVMDGPDS